ncbi:telomere recombination family protein [Chlamydia ibidis]|uniref:L-threonylcarbamoyladenylate synthase n=2 Tax=Chlamydia ibidis TaxID=1405396 RepID=S7J4F1_9CHLA|nr:telomere recombination family protein [Chlamydia ibidis]EQM62806.1 yrdC domain protein [Chlamydia ibidis 10-1398/6]
MNSGKIAAFPTETVYGLGISIRFSEFQDQLYAIKSREKTKQLVIYVNSIQEMQDIACSELSPKSIKLADTFLPGPLTLVIQHNNPNFIEKTIGFRISSHPVVRELINNVGPLLGTSANISNFPPAITYAEVQQDFLDKDIAILSGTCDFGLETTVVDPENLKIYREGLVPCSQLENIFGASFKIEQTSTKKPWQIYSFKTLKLLHQFVEQYSFPYGLIVENPSPSNFYPSLRKVMSTKEKTVLFVYDPITSLYPEMAPYLVPYLVNI